MIGQVPYRREGAARTRYRHLREFWSRGGGPGTITCGASYATETPDGAGRVTCNLRRRPGHPHAGRHAYVQARAVPVRWAGR